MKTILEFPIAFAGLNGKKGLIREHHTKKAKRKELLINMILEQDPNFHQGPVKITYTRHSPGLMDWFDNLPSTGKTLLDALVKLKVIQDDSPEIIPFQPVMHQAIGTAWTQIIIEDLTEDEIENQCSNQDNSG